MRVSRFFHLDLRHGPERYQLDFESGTITQILGENGQAVEYGQPLFVIE